MIQEPPCSCPLAGWCERFGIEQQEYAHEVCQGKRGEELGNRYRAKWRRQKEGGKTPPRQQPVPQMYGPPRTPGGPGTELTKLLKELGIRADGCGGCHDMAAKMDRWGPDGCREHRAEIVEHLREKAAKRKWTEKLTAAANAAAMGLWLNPLDLYGSLADEAIRRAEKTLG